MTILECITEIEENLRKNNIEEARLKARIILENVLKKRREYLEVHLSEKIDKKSEIKIREDLDRLLKCEPIQYITGKQEFMGIEFKVNENVLIPRSDTEVLVLEILEILKDEKNKNISSILDLCTGSGAIIISLAKNLAKRKIDFYGSDISRSALEVAKENCKMNNTKVNFFESDLFEKIENIKFDLIVSNPPYIERNVIDTLEEHVKKEPIIALDGGIDGLDFYRKIAKDSKDYLSDNGYLCLEIGYNQKESVIEILKKERL